MTELSKFIKEIESFLEKHSMRKSRFGREAMGDPSFVDDLNNGDRKPSIETVEKVRKFMKAYRP